MLVLFSAAALLAVAAVAWIGRAYARRGGKRGPVVTIAALALGTAAIGVYALSGDPGVPAAPYAPRMAEIEARIAEAQGFQGLAPMEVLAYLYKQARAAPDAPEPRIQAGMVEAAIGRLPDAARSFESALRRDPDNAFAALELARVTAQLQGPTHRDTLARFDRAAELDPANPIPWIYRGLAATQQGRREDAIAAWRAALERFEENDPRRQMALQMLDRALNTPDTEVRSPS